MLAYFFPPLGGAGVQRPQKFAKYLPQFSWHPYIVTVKNVEFISYDKTSLDELKEIPIYRTGSFDPMRLIYRLRQVMNRGEITKPSRIYSETSERIKQFFRSIIPIDDKIGWLPFAYLKAKKLLNHNKFQAIYATIGPYHTAITGYKLSRKYKLPLIIDYRDLWTQHPYLIFLTRWHREISEKWERKILFFATHIIVVSPEIKRKLVNKYGRSLNIKITVIPNGWDREDFTKVNIGNQRKKIVITYTGGFYGWQTPEYFIYALLELRRENTLPLNIRIQFIGNYFRNIRKILSNKKLADIIEIVPQVSHQKCIKYLMNSDLLLLFIGEQDGKGVLTGKLFEYMATGKPILAMIPTYGDAANILRDYGNHYITEIDDIKKIKKLFCQLIKEIQNNKEFAFNTDVRDRYERRNETKQLVEILDRSGA